MNVSELIRQASKQLDLVSDSPRLDAELLLGTVLRKSRAQLYSYGNMPVSQDDQLLFGELLHKRLGGMPVAHITGTKEFWSLPLKVTADTLVPRPETELLIEQALERIPEDENTKVLDLGTGSGAVILAIGSERPNAELHATDTSKDAIEVAEENSSSCRQSVRWYIGSWLEPVEKQKFDVIVSNPPYIGFEETGLTDPELQFEPDQALYSGDDGLDAIRLIVDGAPKNLNSSGWLLLEHGFAQGEAVRQLMAQHGFVEISTICDSAGHPRVSSGRIRAPLH
jgi:release factor glutamine methyltransferase